jgi:hypothetical protein
MKTKLLQNKAMNDKTYRLRREVIGLIHEAKKLVPSLPRLTVRVTDNNPEILGVARTGKNVIWITECSVVSMAVVFHEIPQIDPKLSRAQCVKLFLSYVKRAS